MVDRSKTRIISQQQFDEYTDAWLQFIRSATSADLDKLFRAPNGQWLSFASLPLNPEVVWLLSPIGVRGVKVRFALTAPESVAGQKDQPPRFSVILYASDELNGRISAYYLADVTWPLGEPSLPNGLMGVWLRNWVSNQGSVTPAMFASHYGPKQGLDFDAFDFFGLLAVASTFTNKTLRLHFALHEYYAPQADPNAAPQQKFGLVLRAHTNTKETHGGADDGSYGDDPDEPSFDMATPYPPGAKH